MAEQVFHRPGPLKQANKAHKTGRHRSKGAIENALKGKTSCKTISHKHKAIQRREQRRNHMNQLRKTKREDTIALKRKLGGQDTSPFLVCILPMHLHIDPQSALAILKKCDDEVLVEELPSGVCYISLPRLKQRFTFVIPPVGRGEELVVLDYLKVCDTTLMLTSAHMGEDEIFDKWGHRIFNMMSAQGIPTPIVALMDLASLNPKKRSSAKAAAQKFLTKLLPKEKLMQFDTNNDGLNIIRRIGGQKKNVLHNRNNRPHLFGDYVDYKCKENDEGELYVTGFLRGTPLDVNGLIHISGLGDFQMSEILGSTDLHKVHKSNNLENKECRLIAKADPTKQISLQSEHVPDAMDAEQTWPTEDEIQEAQEETKKMKLIKKVPKGFSNYQAAWIPDTEWVTEEDKDDEQMDDDDDDDNDCEDDNMSCEEDKSSDEEFEKASSDRECNENVDSASISDVAVNDEKYDLQIDFQEERESLKKIKEARVDQMWPDEMDTPQNIPARTRFQKFRGLESYRTSPWDVKENLPADYARIYQFQNFDRTKRRVISEAKNTGGIMPGLYITIVVSGVSSSKWKDFKSAYKTDNIVMYGLLPHEHQMSVMNVVLKRLPDSEVPLKSKERLIIQCGYRRFIVNPIFSQHTNGNKHKFERYFRPHTTICATFYGPIQFPPAPVLAFKTNPDTSLVLMAHGHMLSCNPDRVILKRVVLSGHPMRIHRKSATIRYMFFNKEDVEYFKPIKLRTKCGRLGHIKESLGTHGHMKCIFDGQLRSYDTVLLYLYKRVYPKWTYSDCLISCAEERKEETMQVE